MWLSLLSPPLLLMLLLQSSVRRVTLQTGDVSSHLHREIPCEARRFLSS